MQKPGNINKPSTGGRFGDKKSPKKDPEGKKSGGTGEAGPRPAGPRYPFPQG